MKTTAARPVAVVAAVVFTVRALDRSLLSSVVGAPAAVLSGAVGLTAALAGPGDALSAGGQAVMQSLASSEQAARGLAPLRLLLDATELDSRAAAIGMAAWRQLQPILEGLWRALLTLRALLFR